MLNKQKISFVNSDSLINDEIDFNLILKFFVRNKIFISVVTFIFFVSAFIVSTRLKKIWAGEFQIVMNTENDAPTVNINPLLQNFSNITPKNDLMTEVEILKSPSVLMPIFDYVVSSKEKRYDKVNQNFSNWKNSLNINLENNTSILNISYRDKDKDLILPVLNLISTTYQKYSGKTRSRNQELTKTYLNNQIDIFKVKSSNSLKAAQEFAIDEDLMYLDEMVNLEKSISPLLPNISIENIRVQSANEIRRIDLQVKKITEIGNDYQKLQYIGSTIPALREEGLPQELAEIEKELVEKRSKYTDDDLSILRTIDKRNLIIKLLKKRAIGYMQAKKIELEATMEAAMRPKGVLLKYKELLREASRDELTLISLENQLRASELEDSRIKDPWELITMPTLLEDPVAPRKRYIALGGLAIGLFFGILFAMTKEKNSGKIFDIKTFENIFSAPIIEKINIDEVVDKEKVCIYLREYIKNNFDKKICLSAISEVDKGYLSKLKDIIINTQELKKLDNVDLILDNYKIENFMKSNERLLLVSLNNLDYEQIKEFKRNLLIFDIKISGLILLETN